MRFTQNFVLTSFFRDGIIRGFMSHQPVIDGLEFASTGARLEGVSPLSDYPRLKDMLASNAGEVAYAVRGIRDEQGRPALQVRASGMLPLRCQRCLEPLDYEMAVDERLVLAASQAEIDAEPPDVNAPNRIVAGREMPVRDLVEDELILALPYAPRHEACAAHPGEAEEGGRSPFADLRGLMRSKQ
jgi:uncharacterized protein